MGLSELVGGLLWSSMLVSRGSFYACGEMVEVRFEPRKVCFLLVGVERAWEVGWVWDVKGWDVEGVGC